MSDISGDQNIICRTHEWLSTRFRECFGYNVLWNAFMRNGTKGDKMKSLGPSTYMADEDS